MFIQRAKVFHFLIIRTGTGSFVITTESNRTKTVPKLIPFFTVNQLRISGDSPTGTVNIRYCVDRGTAERDWNRCGKEDGPVQCRLDWSNSLYDDNGWKRLWNNEWEVDFEVVHHNQLKVSVTTSIFVFLWICISKSFFQSFFLKI